jgi:biotin-dependent carboxylase-like uncharacterized protein
MTEFRIVQPGLLTTVQDLGRIGHQALGVPVSGALDGIALRLANRLVGNSSGDAALEIIGIGPVFTVTDGTARVALVGGGARLIVGDRPALDPGASVTLKEGIEIRVGGPLTGPAYLAAAGGFAVPEFLGSRSTYLRNTFGGFDGRALRPRDMLPLRLDAPPPGAELRLASPWDYAETSAIRVVLGPQDDYFSPDGLARFLGSTYIVTKDADRMGLRLDGPAIDHPRGFDIPSDGIVTGSIQVPGNGKPIILLADHQTVGGYPKIATVISADIARLAHALPGTALRFEAISVAEAEQARRELERRLALHPIEPWSGGFPGEPDEALLYAENLISGVTDGL